MFNGQHARFPTCRYRFESGRPLQPAGSSARLEQRPDKACVEGSNPSLRTLASRPGRLRGAPAKRVYRVRFPGDARRLRSFPVTIYIPGRRDFVNTTVVPAQIKRPWADVEAEQAARAAERAAEQEADRQRALAQRAEWDAEYGEATALIRDTFAPYNVRIVRAAKELDWGVRAEGENRYVPVISLFTDQSFAAWVVANLNPDVDGNAALIDAILTEASSSGGVTIPLYYALRHGTVKPTGYTRNVTFTGDDAIYALVCLALDPDAVAKLAPLAPTGD